MTSSGGGEVSTRDDVGGVDLGDLCFTARALAQTHPMSGPSLRYRQECFERERQRQHVTDLADWASTALLVGYCLRRSEEQAVGPLLQPSEADSETFSAGASELSETLRTGDADSVTLLSPDLAIAAIDRIIGTEIHKRDEHLREQLDEAAWAEFEGYIAWWVVHGYCVRVVETR